MPVAIGIKTSALMENWSLIPWMKPFFSFMKILLSDICLRGFENRPNKKILLCLTLSDKTKGILIEGVDAFLEYFAVGF
jgi:hypothetical protein